MVRFPVPLRRDQKSPLPVCARLCSNAPFVARSRRGVRHCVFCRRALRVRETRLLLHVCDSLQLHECVSRLQAEARSGRQKSRSLNSRCLF